MSRTDLLKDTQRIVEGLGFKENDSEKPSTYQRNVKYPSIFSEKNDYANFLLYTPNGTIQILARFQEVSGTAIDKLAYIPFDAARTNHDHYIVVCGGVELLKMNRAVCFLNEHKKSAPVLHALDIDKLASYLERCLNDKAA
ncbi:PD-(D/E)XK nuclease superfamily protein [Vibrio sp. WJH972]